MHVTLPPTHTVIVQLRLASINLFLIHPPII